MSWLMVFFTFQLGVIPGGYIDFYQPAEVALFEHYDATFKIDAEMFDFVKIGGHCITLFAFRPEEGRAANFTPTGMTFFFYAGIEPFEGLSIIYEHSCSHPIAAYIPLREGNPILDSSYDRIYLEIKGRMQF